MRSLIVLVALFFSEQRRIKKKNRSGWNNVTRGYFSGDYSKKSYMYVYMGFGRDIYMYIYKRIMWSFAKNNTMSG